MVYPTYSGNPFQGTPSFAGFNDGQPLASVATAKSVIGDVFNPSPINVADQAINIPYWNLYQAAGASLYAYEQLNFAADYQILTASPLLGGVSTVPLSIVGSVVGGGNLQFDATMTYTWADINTAGIVGSPTTLGSLTYRFTQTGGGAFSQTLLPVGTLAPTPLLSTAGILEITGYAYLAGDPFEVTVTPEPAALSLLALGAMTLRRTRRA
jgi:MYXO-CTERM domain-containing protein